MTEITDKNEQPEQTAQEPVLPGKRLQAARQARGLSREEVASQLRLQVRLIAALEEDDYDVLPAQTFVSGYLRSYARLLELPDDSFATPVTSKSEPPPLVAAVASKKQASSRDWLARLVTYLVIGAIGVSVVMWWLAQRQTVEPELPVARPEIVEPGGSLDLALPESAPPAADKETAVPDEAGEPASQPEESAVAASGETAVASDETAPVVEAVGQSDAPEAGEPASLSEAMPQSKLEMRFEADSWTEVSDNAERRLAYGLIKAGEVLVLRGEAPFRVFLGYAPGVTVYYNNDLFDHSPFQRRDVARFRIGRAEHNHPGSR